MNWTLKRGDIHHFDHLIFIKPGGIIIFHQPKPNWISHDLSGIRRSPLLSYLLGKFDVWRKKSVDKNPRHPKNNSQVFKGFCAFLVMNSSTFIVSIIEGLTSDGNLNPPQGKYGLHKVQKDHHSPLIMIGGLRNCFCMNIFRQAPNFLNCLVILGFP